MGAIAAIPNHEAAEPMGRSIRPAEQNSDGLAVAGNIAARNGKAKPTGAVQMPLLLMPGQNLSPEDLAIAEARYRSIEPLIRPGDFGAMWEQCRGRKTDMVELIARQSAAKPRTVYSWLKAWNAIGLSGLVGKDRSDKGLSRKLNKAAEDYLLAALLPGRTYGEFSIKEAFRAYNEERMWRVGKAGVKLDEATAKKYERYVDSNGCLLLTAQLPEASYETVRRFVNHIPEAVRTMARGQEAYRNTQEIISYRDLARVQPMDYLVMDHRLLDLYCMVPRRGGWKLIRPWLTAAIDMRTRKWLAWVIVETPSSDSIAAVLKRTFIDHGTPQACYWDNGRDYRCKWLEGGQEHSTVQPGVKDLPDAWRGVMDSLGIRVHHAIVKNARAKIIEPNFLRIAHFDRTLPEWCGRNAASKPELLDRLLKEHEAWLRKEIPNAPFRTLENVASLYKGEIGALNERELEGDGMKKITPSGMGWMCPNECWELTIDRVERRSVPDDVLRFCFQKRREITVKHGEAHAVFGGVPRHYRMGNHLLLMGLNGRKVELAYDPLDLEEVAIYCDSRFVGIAVCAELRRMGEAGFVEDERNRRAARREIKNIIAVIHQTVPVADADTRQARRTAVLPARESAIRVEAPVDVPEAIREAAAASKAERGVPFEEIAGGIEATPPPPEDGDDGSFQFFSDRANL
jgi:hypothetical protein